MLKLDKYFYWVNPFAFSPRYKEGDLTLYALNLHNVTKRLQLPHHLFDKQVDKYLIKPSGPNGLFSKWVIFLVHFKLSPKVNFIGVCQNTMCWKGAKKKKTQLFQVLTILNIQEVTYEYMLIQVWFIQRVQSGRMGPQISSYLREMFSFQSNLIYQDPLNAFRLFAPKRHNSW